MPLRIEIEDTIERAIFFSDRVHFQYFFPTVEKNMHASRIPCVTRQNIDCDFFPDRDGFLSE